MDDEERETKEAMEFMDREDVFDPEPIELRARITILEGAIAFLASKLSSEDHLEFKRFLKSGAKTADDMNNSLVGHKFTRHEELTHHLHLSARELLERVEDITPPQSA